MKVNSEAIYETRPIKPYEQGDWVFTAKRDGTVYAILLAKDDQATLPQQVAMPAEILAGRTKVAIARLRRAQGRRNRGRQDDLHDS